MTKTARQRKKVKSYQPRTTRRKHKNLRKVAASSGSKLIDAQWDKCATVQQNYARLGLVGNANWNQRQIDERMSVVPEEQKERIDFAPVIGEDETSVKTIPPGELRLLEELVAKHGVDCGAMARDIKVNVYQHSAKQLFRKVKMYLTQHAPKRVAALESANEDLFD